MTLVPAYLRDYKSIKAVREALLADKDFIISDVSSRYNGKLINRPQLIEALDSSTYIKVRYRSLRRIATFKIGDLS